MPLIAETTFWGVIGWIFWVFLLAIWFYLLIVVFMDLFSRHDLSGWAKAAWTIGIIIFPLIGILIYLITRPKPTPEEVAEDVIDIRMMREVVPAETVRTEGAVEPGMAELVVLGPLVRVGKDLVGL